MLSGHTAPVLTPSRQRQMKTLPNSVNVDALCKTCKPINLSHLISRRAFYPQLFNRICGSLKSTKRVEFYRRKRSFGRSFKRNTNFNPDQISSTAQTFTSTIPLAMPIARITSSVRSVATPEDFFGHEIQNIAEEFSFAQYRSEEHKSELQ